MILFALILRKMGAFELRLYLFRVLAAIDTLRCLDLSKTANIHRPCVDTMSPKSFPSSRWAAVGPMPCT